MLEEPEMADQFYWYNKRENKTKNMKQLDFSSFFKDT